MCSYPPPLSNQHPIHPPPSNWVPIPSSCHILTPLPLPPFPACPHLVIISNYSTWHNFTFFLKECWQYEVCGLIEFWMHGYPRIFFFACYQLYCHYWTCIFPTTPHVCLSVGWYVGWLIGRSVKISLKSRKLHFHALSKHLLNLIPRGTTTFAKIYQPMVGCTLSE